MRVWPTTIARMEAGRSRGRTERLGAFEVAGFSLAEWAPTILLVPVALFEILRPSGQVNGPTGWLLVFYASAPVVLLWRHRRPVTVTAVVCLIILTPALLWGTSHLSAWVLSLATITFAAGRYARSPGSFLALLVAVLTVLVLLALVLGVSSVGVVMRRRLRRSGR